jgi:hypothetical protein
LETTADTLRKYWNGPTIPHEGWSEFTQNYSGTKNPAEKKYELFFFLSK